MEGKLLSCRKSLMNFFFRMIANSSAREENVLRKKWLAFEGETWKMTDFFCVDENQKFALMKLEISFGWIR